MYDLNNIAFFALFHQGNSFSHSRASAHLHSNTVLFYLWMNPDFKINLVSQWCNYPFIKVDPASQCAYYPLSSTIHYHIQALVISRLDYCNALLAGLPSNTIKPLQMIQNAAARLVFNEPKSARVTPLFISLHWLPVAARIQFKTLMLAYRTTTGSAPTYFHSLLRIYIPSRSLRSASERRLVVPSQRGSKSLSRTFSFTVPGRWNDLPTPIRNAGSLSNFKQQLKTHLFQLYLTT